MPFFPGAGYGIAQAGAAASAAMVEAHRHEEGEALKQRQMTVNEAAQAASGAYYGAVTNTMNQNEQRTQAGFNNIVNTYGVLNGTASTTTPGTPPTPNPLPSNPIVGAVQPPGGGYAQTAPQPTPVPAGGAVATPPVGDPSAPATDASAPAPANGAPGDSSAAVAGNAGYGAGAEAKKALTANEAHVPTGGPSGANARTNLRGAAPTPVPPGAVDTTGSGGRPVVGQVIATGKGQFTITPNEGNGYIDASKKLVVQAAEVQKRLDEGLKAIDARYTNDPTMATYLKANLISSITPQIAAMNTAAATAKNTGELANHMQVGAALSAAIIGKFNEGGIIDDKFVESYRPMMEKLGVSSTDLKLFTGMHMSDGRHPGDNAENKGFIVNAGGFIIPPKAMWDASNYALPFAQRAAAWEGMTNMYKDQMAAKSNMIQAYNLNPKLAIEYAAQQTQKTAEQLSNLTRLKDTAQHQLVHGGPLSVVGEDGKPTIVNIPEPTKDANGSVDGNAVFEGYKSRFFARDKTLPPAIQAGVKHYLEAEQGVNTATTMLPLYSGFSTGRYGGSVQARPNTNTTRDNEDNKAGGKTKAAVATLEMKAIIDKGERATAEEKTRLREYTNGL